MASAPDAPRAELARRIAAALDAGDVADKHGLQALKHRLARELGLATVPADPQLRQWLPDDVVARHAALLRKKPMRSQSGVAIVAVMSSPAACPHGKCVYCPGGPDVGVPQSYTGHEPSTMRAMRLDYDPYRVVRTRLGRLAANGHPTDKVELIIQGGTFPARDPAYQDWFVAMLYAGCNDGPCEADPGPLEAPEAWTALDEAARAARLARHRDANEHASCRAVGLTVETKPDWCMEPQLDRMLEHGCTRIELGVQTLDEDVLALTHRGHTLEDTRRAWRLARDAGFKVCVHMMPGQPRQRLARPSEVREDLAPPGQPRQGLGRPREAREVLAPPGQALAAPSPHHAAPAGLPITGARVFHTDPEADVEDLRRLFAEEDWRPDMLKIYPTLVVEEGETPLKRWWREGRYTPYGTEEARAVVAAGLAHVPPYCRVQRVDRDIPTTHVVAGVMNSNLRQLAEADAAGAPGRDIRSREAGVRARAGVLGDVARAKETLLQYPAAGGEEAFLAVEDPVADVLFGFCRVRRVADPHRPELRGAAVVRELKVYGAAVPLGRHEEGAFQHHGLGARLLARAEEQARAWGRDRLAVLAGPGVKEYYRRHGFTDHGPYLEKALARPAPAEATP